MVSYAHLLRTKMFERMEAMPMKIDDIKQTSEPKSIVIPLTNITVEDVAKAIEEINDKVGAKVIATMWHPREIGKYDALIFGKVEPMRITPAGINLSGLGQ